MASTDPYINDSLDYIYLDIDQTTLEPSTDEYGGESAHIVTSTDYLSVLSSPKLTYGRKYFVYCVFFVTGAEEDFYDYRIVDGLGTQLADGVFNIKNTQAKGTGYDDTNSNGTYGSWFKVFYANSNSSIYFETKAKGVDNYSAVYYAQFLTIDITDLKEDYHYFYKEDRVSTSSPTTKYTIQPDENTGASSDWILMSSYSNLNLDSTIGTVNLTSNGNSIFADEGANADGGEGWNTTNRPKTIFNTITLSDATDISLTFSPSSGDLFYPKIFGLRTDTFDDSNIYNGGGTSLTLQKADSTLDLGSAEVSAKNTEYFILGQISQDGIFTYDNGSLTVRNNIGISCDVTVDNSTALSYPIDKYSIVHDVDLTNASTPETYQLRNQIIPISLHVPNTSDSISVQFTIHNNGISESISFNHFTYSILGNKVKRYAPRSVSLEGKALKDISPDMMVCSYTNSGIDSESSIIGGFDTEDPRNYVIDGLGNKLPLRWSSTLKDYFFNRGKISNPLSNQDAHHILSLGNIPERPHPFRTDIFDIDEYDCLAATLYDDVTISLRSRYFEDDEDEIDEACEFYMILDKKEWYEGDSSITIGEYQTYESASVDDLNSCKSALGSCFIRLNFSNWNLSSSEKKIFHFYTNNTSNKNNSSNDTEKYHRYWFAKEIKPSSNLNRVSRHFNYEDVFVEDTVPDFISGSTPLVDYKFVFKSNTSLADGKSFQTQGRARSFQATDIFNDKDESSLSSFIAKSEEDLRDSLEYQLLGDGADSSDPYFYATLDSSNAHIYFYMPPDWASLHLSYKLIDEDLFNNEKETQDKWSSTSWSSSLFQDYIGAISRRLKVLRETLIDGLYSSIFSYNTGSRVGLHSFITNFYGDSSSIETLNTTDYLIQNSYELATSDYDLLKYSDYLQVELFPRWGILDSYSDDDLKDYIDMHLEYASKVVDKESTSVCRLFPIITHKVRNSSSNSHLMVTVISDLNKFIERIEYHIDNINYSFWEYGIYNESDYDNLYATPSDSSLSSGLGYSGGYIDSHPWTSDSLDPNGLQINESSQPYLHGQGDNSTTILCYYTSLFVDDPSGVC